MARKVKLSAAKADKPATEAKAEVKTEAAKPAKVVKAKPVREPKAPLPTHDGKAFKYAGASPALRTGRRLSPITSGHGAAVVTERDADFIRGVKATYGNKPFERLNMDAGCIRRAIAHGFMTHVSGDLGHRDAKFQLTAEGMKRS